MQRAGISSADSFRQAAVVEKPESLCAARSCPGRIHAAAHRASLASAPMGKRGGVAKLVVYSRPGCHLCSDAMAVLHELQDELGFELEELDISADERLERAYFERIPVVTLDGEELSEYFVDEAALRERLKSVA
jgi:glutaredoxin